MEPERHLDSFAKEAVRRGIIDPPTGRVLVGLWAVNLWKTNLANFYTLWKVLSFAVIAMSGYLGIRAIWNAPLLRGMAERLDAGVAYFWVWSVRMSEVAWRGVTYLYTIAEWLIVGVCSWCYGVAAWVLGWIWWAVAAIANLAYDAGLAVYLWLRPSLSAAIDWLLALFGSVFGYIWQWAGRAIGFCLQTLVDIGSWLCRSVYALVAWGLETLWSILGPVFHGIGEAVATAWEFLGRHIGPFFSWLYSIAMSGMEWVLWAARAVGQAIYGAIGWVWDAIVTIARFVGNSCFWVLDNMVRGIMAAPAWLYDMALSLLDNAQKWYWSTVTSEGMIVALFSLALLVDFVADVLAKKTGRARLVTYMHVFQAGIFSWMLGHIVELFAIHFTWDGIEILSMCVWIIMPLFIAALTGARVFFYEILSLGILALHIVTFYCGVSGNVFVTLDIAVAVILVCAADAMKSRWGAQAVALRYYAIGIMGFILYCCGMVWDLVDILELRSYAAPSSLERSNLFLLSLIGITVVMVGWSYWRKGAARSRNDAVLCLLLLLTLLYSYFPAAIMLRVVSVGSIIDFGDYRFATSIFASNMLIITVLAWAAWFAWCLWLLAESSNLNSGLMAQIAVAAILCSLETRYVEILFRVSVTAALVVMPFMLALIFVAIHIIRGWLERLGASQHTPAAVGGS